MIIFKQCRRRILFEYVGHIVVAVSRYIGKSGEAVHSIDVGIYIIHKLETEGFTVGYSAKGNYRAGALLVVSYDVYDKLTEHCVKYLVGELVGLVYFGDYVA